MRAIDPLTRLVARMSREPQFIAHWFYLWMSRHGRTISDVAGELRCTPATAVKIAMCAAPRPGQVYDDLSCVSYKFEVEIVPLARLVFLCRPAGDAAESVHVNKRG